MKILVLLRSLEASQLTNGWYRFSAFFTSCAFTQTSITLTRRILQTGRQGIENAPYPGRQSTISRPLLFAGASMHSTSLHTVYWMAAVRYSPAPHPATRPGRFRQG